MLLYVEIQKIFKSRKFLFALVIMIGFNLFYCWFASKYAFNRNIKYTQSFISDYEKKIKELEQKIKKEKDEKIKNLYQQQIVEMRMVIEEQKLKLQYATNPKKEMEVKAKYYKMMYENAKKAGNYKELEVYNVNYKILSENIKKKKFYNVGEQFDAWIYLISQADGVAFFMIIILALLIGSGIVSDEYKERTIKLLKTMPVKRGKIILIKFIATVLTLSILIIGIQIIFFIVLGVITDSLKYYDVYYDWISKYKAIGFKVYPILNSSKILTLFECGLLLFLVEIVVIFVICGAIVFFSTIFENGAFAVVSFITMILCISILRQQMFVQRISILKLLPLVFPWNFEEVYSNSLAEKIQLSFVSSYIVIGLNLLLAVIFVLSSIKIFKTKENV